MNHRTFGATGLSVSEIGFGCGDTAGLMISGTSELRVQGVARALEIGINYFDTAPMYGSGVSETHLGLALRELHAHPIVATKVGLRDADLEHPARSAIRSVEGSLKRLGMESVALIQLHNRVVASQRASDTTPGLPFLSIDQVLGPDGVVEGFEQLRREGKVSAFGFCGFGGDIGAIDQVIDGGRFHSLLAYYNLLNPSAGMPMPRACEGPDYGQIMDHAGAAGMGVVVLRALAAGALSGLAGRRHLLAGYPPRTETYYESNVTRAEELRFLVADGKRTLAQAAICFALMKPEVSTVLVGFSGIEQIDEAASCSGAPGLPASALRRLRAYHTPSPLAGEGWGEGART